MMQLLRSNARLVMIILIAAFGGWGIFAVGMDATGQGGASLSSAAARVNGVEIDLETYWNALRQAQEARQQQGGYYGTSLEEERAFEDAVLENLIQSVLLNQEFRRRGIRVSTEEIIAAAQTSPPPEVLQSPSFQTDGVFDPDKYRRFLATNVDPGFSMALEARYREEIPRAKLFEQLTADVYLSNAKLWQIYRDQNDSVTFRLLELVPDEMVADSEVTLTDDDLRAYYGAHLEDFAQPASAYLSYVTASRETNATDTTAAFERAEALRAEIVDGTPFADVAERESADSTSRIQGGDLGPLARGILISEFEDAAIALRDGEMSEPVLTAFGYHIIRRERVTRDSVHASHILIPIELADEHLDVVESQADTMDLFGAELEDPGALDEVAEMLDLPVLSTRVQQDVRLALNGRNVPDASLWAFEARPGETSRVVEAPYAYFLFRLDSLREAGPAPFEQVEGAVRRAAIRERKLEMVREAANEISTNVQGGQALAVAALEYLVNFRTLGPMTRFNPHPELAPLPEVVGAAFGLGVGQTSAPIETDMGIFFVEPTAKFLADSTSFQAELPILRIQLIEAARRDRLQRFMASLRDGADIVDRRRLIERAQRDLEEQLERNPNQFNPLGF